MASTVPKADGDRGARSRHSECMAALAAGNYDAYRAARQFRSLEIDQFVASLREWLDRTRPLIQGGTAEGPTHQVPVAARAVSAAERERQRIARELHDSVAQQVSLVSIELSLLRRHLRESPPTVQDQLARVSGLVEELGEEIRELSHEMHPRAVESLGLTASLRVLCERLSKHDGPTIALTVSPDFPSAAPGPVVLALYRIAQEALRNIVRHSQSTAAHVTLQSDERELTLTVEDDGIGFRSIAPAKKDSLGLMSMRERAQSVGGRLAISSQPGRGTTVVAHVPLPRHTLTHVPASLAG